MNIRLISFLLIIFFFIHNNFVNAQPDRVFASNVTIEENVIEPANSVDADLSTFSLLPSNSGVALGIRSFSSTLEVVFPELILSEREIIIRMDFDADIFNVLLGNTTSDELGNLILGNHTLEIQARNNNQIVKSAITSRPDEFMEDDLFAFVDENGNQFISITLAEPVDRIRFIDRTNALLGFNVDNSSSIYGVFLDFEEPVEPPISSFELIKSSSVLEINPGEQLIYTFTITNTGNEELDDVEIIDVLPEGTSFISASDDGEFENGSVIWELDDLDPGEEKIFTLVVRVSDELEAGTVISNTATGTDEDDQEVTSNEVRVNVVAAEENPAEATLELVKTASATEVEPGETLDFQLTLSNTGQSAAPSIVLTDVLPMGTIFVSASDGGVFADGTVTWDLGALPPRTERVFNLEVAVAEDLVTGTVIINTANAESRDQEVSSNTVQVTVVAADEEQEEASFTVVKTSSANEVQPGATLTYQLTITNTGDDELDDVEVVDVLPVGTTFISASDGGEFSNGRVIWELDDLEPGEEKVLTFEVLVSDEIEPGTVISNTATATDEDDQEVISNEVLVTVVATDEEPTEVSFELVKAASVTQVAPGEAISYQFTLTNTGEATAIDINITDVLPIGTTFISASDGGQFTNGTVTWEVDELEPGEERILTLDVLVSEELESGTVLSNIATASDNELEVTSNEVLVTVLAPDEDPAEVSFELAKAATVSQVGPGEAISYQLTLTNTGEALAIALVVSDELPVGTTFISASDGGQFANGTVTWEVDELELGEERILTLEVLVSEELESGTVLSNIATADGNDLEVTSNEVLVTVVATDEEPAEVSFELGKVASVSQVAPGEAISYQLSLTNTGEAPAISLVISDVLPVGTTFVSASDGGQFANGTVTWEVDELEPGEERILTLEVLVSVELESGTILSNIATAADNELEVTSNEVLVTVVATDEDPAEVSFELVKAASVSQVAPGEAISYQLTLTNTGEATAIDINITDVLPVGTTFISASDGGQFANGTVTWEIDELEPGEERILTLEVLVSEELESGTILSNIATADGNELEVTSNEVLVTVLAPDEDPAEVSFELAKAASVSQVAPGEAISYQLSLTNTGEAPAIALVVSDDLPVGTTFISASDGGQFANGTVTWEVDELEPGEERILTLEVLVSEELESGTILSNIATAADNELEVTSNEMLVTVVATDEDPAEVSFELGKVASVSQVAPGEAISYQLSLTNTGEALAIALVVSDELPVGTTFISASDGGQFDNGTVTWEIDELEPGEERILTLEVLVSEELESGTVLSNIATAADNELEVTSNEVLVTVVATDVEPTEVSFELGKVASVSQVAPGEAISYQLSLTNTGEAPAIALVVSDLLPVGTSFISASDGGQFANGTVTWEIDELEPGEERILTLEVLVSEELESGTVLSNIAIVSNGEEEVNSNEVQVTVLFEDQRTEIEITKTPNTLISATGEIVTYEIIIYNRGLVDATNVLVIDSIPIGLMPIAATNGGVITDATVEWNILLIEAQDSVVLSLEGMVTLDVGSIVNQVFVSGENFEPDFILSAPIVVNELDLFLAKSVSSPRVVTGVEFKYTLSVTNNSEFTAAEILVIDTIPEGVQFRNATPERGQVNFDAQLTVLSWQIESLEPGDTLNLEIEVKAGSAGTFTNTAFLQLFQEGIPTTISMASVTHEQFDFEITNVFTPNGDGINDTWQIRNLQTLFPNNRLLVVNRYGVEVFKTENYQNDWDGSNLNKGTYFYQLTVFDEAMGEVTFTGFVMIVK